jgi:hypothetical protein
MTHAYQMPFTILLKLVLLRKLYAHTASTVILVQVIVCKLDGRRALTVRVGAAAWVGKTGYAARPRSRANVMCVRDERIVTCDVQLV